MVFHNMHTNSTVQCQYGNEIASVSRRASLKMINKLLNNCNNVRQSKVMDRIELIWCILIVIQFRFEAIRF